MHHVKAFAYTAAVCLLTIAAANRVKALRKALATDTPTAG